MSQTRTYDDLGPRDQALIDEAGGGNQTVVSARMVKALNGNGNAAIMMSQLLFWSRTKADEDGWFFRTRQQMEARCGLGKKAQQNAAETLSDLGLIEADLRGMPARKHYRVHLSSVISLLADAEQDRAHGSKQDRAHGSKQDRAHGSGSYYRQDTRQDTESEGARPRGDEAVQVYHDVMPRRANNVQKDYISTQVEDLDRWREVLRDWRAEGYSPKSVKKMLDVYENGWRNESSDSEPNEIKTQWHG